MLHQLLQYALHIDIYLLALVSRYGAWTYLILFLVIFMETGLVVTPFLPGDSLLFAAGSIAAQPTTPLSIQLLSFILIFASILGNQTNYAIGRLLGPNVFSGRYWLNQRHLQEAHVFYEKHGGKTILFARFLPIVRTFVPFVAGISAMHWRSFTAYNIGSAMLWIVSLLAAGYFFGSLPFIKAHFSLVIYGIVLISLLPTCFTLAYRAFKRTSPLN